VNQELQQHNQESALGWALVNSGELLPFELAESDREEVLTFLARRPVDNVIMAGWIYDRGIISTAHRGKFYGCRNAQGSLNGVALIGRITMFDTANPEVAALFGTAAREALDVRVVFGETSCLEKFWQKYAGYGQQPRLICRELLYQFDKPFEAAEHRELRPATIFDLDKVVAAHAEMVLEETGSDPLKNDREGFRRRCAERVQREHVWVCDNGEELIFKADIVTETPEAVYVEGAWVNPKFRRANVGRHCLAAVSRHLLALAPVCCFFVNEDNAAARQLYESFGLKAVNTVTKYIV
jgi:hypothetical protein